MQKKHFYVCKNTASAQLCAAPQYRNCAHLWSSICTQEHEGRLAHCLRRQVPPLCLKERQQVQRLQLREGHPGLLHGQAHLPRGPRARRGGQDGLRRLRGRQEPAKEMPGRWEQRIFSMFLTIFFLKNVGGWQGWYAELGTFGFLKIFQ